MFTIRMHTRFGRSAALAVLFGAFSAVSATAQEAVHFRGGGFAANFSGCEDHGISGAFAVSARYSPAEVTGEDNYTDLSILVPWGAASFSRQGPLDFTFQSVQGTQIVTGAYRVSPRPRIRIMSQDPEVITEQTREIQMRVRIRNFNGLSGCQADVGLVMSRFPMLP